MAKTYTTEEAATALGVTPGRVRQMIVDGQIRTARFGHAHVITAAALEEARRRKTKPGPVPKASGADGRVKVKKGGKK